MDPILPIGLYHTNKKQNPVYGHINDYIASRDAFANAGGWEFISDRREMRAAYCDANISQIALAKWISKLPEGEIRNEFANRFHEWDAKIAKGFLKKNENSLLSEGEFFEKLQDYYNKYENFLGSPVFAEFTSAKAILRKDLLPELKSASAETVAKGYGIKDLELIDRMKFKWSWKA